MRRIGLKAFRVDCGMTVAVVAQKMGVAPNTICRWENGETAPTYPQLARLCEIYDCSPDDVRFDMSKKSAES